jgi:hypothetical protein
MYSRDGEKVFYYYGLATNSDNGKPYKYISVKMDPFQPIWIVGHVQLHQEKGVKGEIMSHVVSDALKCDKTSL